MRFLLKHEKNQMEFDDPQSSLRVKGWPGLGVVELVQDSANYGIEQVVIPVKLLPKLMDLFMLSWVRACQVQSGEPTASLPRRPERTLAAAVIDHCKCECVNPETLDEIERRCLLPESSDPSRPSQTSDAQSDS